MPRRSAFTIDMAKAIRIQSMVRGLLTRIKIRAQIRLRAQREVALDALVPLYAEHMVIPDTIPESRRRAMITRLIERDCCHEEVRLSPQPDHAQGEAPVFFAKLTSPCEITCAS